MLSPVFASGWSSWHGKALLGKTFNEQDHPRDEHGHFIDGAGDGHSSDPVAAAEQVLADTQTALNNALANEPPESGEAPDEPDADDYPEQEDGSSPEYDAAYDAWQEAMEAHEAATEAREQWEQEVERLEQERDHTTEALSALREQAAAEAEEREQALAEEMQQVAFEAAATAHAGRQASRDARRAAIDSATDIPNWAHNSPGTHAIDDALTSLGNTTLDKWENVEARAIVDVRLTEALDGAQADMLAQADKQVGALKAGGGDSSKVEAVIGKAAAALDKSADRVRGAREKLQVTLDTKQQASDAADAAQAEVDKAEAVIVAHDDAEPDQSPDTDDLDAILDDPEADSDDPKVIEAQKEKDRRETAQSEAYDAWKDRQDELYEVKEKLEAKFDKSNDRFIDADEKLTTVVEKFDEALAAHAEVWSTQAEKIDEATSNAVDREMKLLDKEDEADPEPDFDDFAPEAKGKSWNPDNQSRGEDGKFGASQSADWTEEDDAWQDAFDEATVAVENSMDKYFGDVESARDEEPTATATLEALAAVDALAKSTATSWNGLVATLKHSGSDVAKARETLATLRQDIAATVADYKVSLIALNNTQGAWGDLSVSDPERDPVDKPAWSDHEPDKPAPEDASDPDSVAEWEDYRQNLEQAREDFADKMKEHGEYKDAVREHKAKVKDADKSRKLALKQERKAFDRLENKVNALKGFADEHLWELRPRGDSSDKSLSFLHMARSGSYQRLWLGYEPNRWGKSLCDWIEGKEFVEEDHVRGPDGRFGSGDGSSAYSTESTELIPVAVAKEARSLYRLALDRVKGWKEKVGAAATALIDKIPGGKYLRGKAAELKAGLEKRYGAKAVKAIVASGYAISWGATGAGAVVGVPVMIPSPIAMLPGLVMAELYHQFSGKQSALAGKAWVGDMDEDEGLSQEDIDRRAEELVAALVAANDGNSGEPSPRGKVYDGVTGKALELRTDSLGRRYCVDEVNGKVRRVPCGREGLPELKSRRAARDKAAVDKAKAAIDAYRKGDSDAATMLASLQGLTRDQLRGLREGLGVGKGDSLKKDLADKISRAALGTLEVRHLEPMGQRPGIDENNSDKEVDKPAGGPTIRVDAKSPVEERPVAFQPPTAPNRTAANGATFSQASPEQMATLQGDFLSAREGFRSLQSIAADGTQSFRSEPFQGSPTHGTVLEKDGKIRVYAVTVKNGTPTVSFVAAERADFAKASAILTAAGLDPAQHMGAIAAHAFGSGVPTMEERVKAYLVAGGVTPPEPAKKARPSAVETGSIEIKVPLRDELRSGDSGHGVEVSRRATYSIGQSVEEGIVTASKRRGKDTVYTVRPHTPAEAKEFHRQARIKEIRELLHGGPNEIEPVNADELRAEIAKLKAGG